MSPFGGRGSFHNCYESEVTSRDPERLSSPTHRIVPLVLPIALALMLLGVALYKWGFLTGSWSGRAYRKIAGIGYLLGLPLVIFSTWHGVIYTPNLEAFLRYVEEVPIPWVYILYPFQRILLVMAHIAILVLIYRSGALPSLVRGLQRVGQMAFTNYILVGSRPPKVF